MFEEVGVAGRGAFGEVVRARSRVDGATYAVKRVLADRAGDSEAVADLRAEVQAMAAAGPHPHLIGYHGAWYDVDEARGGSQMCVQLELAWGTLLDALVGRRVRTLDGDDQDDDSAQAEEEPHGASSRAGRAAGGGRVRSTASASAVVSAVPPTVTKNKSRAVSRVVGSALAGSHSKRPGSRTGGASGGGMLAFGTLGDDDDESEAEQDGAVGAEDGHRRSGSAAADGIVRSAAVESASPPAHRGLGARFSGVSGSGNTTDVSTTGGGQLGMGRQLSFASQESAFTDSGAAAAVCLSDRLGAGDGSPTLPQAAGDANTSFVEDSLPLGPQLNDSVAEEEQEELAAAAAFVSQHPQTATSPSGEEPSGSSRSSRARGMRLGSLFGSSSPRKAPGKSRSRTRPRGDVRSGLSFGTGDDDDDDGVASAGGNEDDDEPGIGLSGQPPPASRQDIRSYFGGGSQPAKPVKARPSRFRGRGANHSDDDDDDESDRDVSGDISDEDAGGGDWAGAGGPMVTEAQMAELQRRQAVEHRSQAEASSSASASASSMAAALAGHGSSLQRGLLLAADAEGLGSAILAGSRASAPSSSGPGLSQASFHSVEFTEMSQSEAMGRGDTRSDGSLMGRVPVTQRDVCTVGRHLALGLAHLHSHGLAHLDLKPRNVLVTYEAPLCDRAGHFLPHVAALSGLPSSDSALAGPGHSAPAQFPSLHREPRYKVADLGRCTSFNDTHARDGDAQYIAMETLNPTPGMDRRPADVLALGLILLEMVTGTALPVRGDEFLALRRDGGEARRLIRQARDRHTGFEAGPGAGLGSDAHARETRPSGVLCSAELESLILAMLQRDPAARPTAEQVAGSRAIAAGRGDASASGDASAGGDSRMARSVSWHSEHTPGCSHGTTAVDRDGVLSTTTPAAAAMQAGFGAQTPWTAATRASMGARSVDSRDSSFEGRSSGSREHDLSTSAVELSRISFADNQASPQLPVHGADPGPLRSVPHGSAGGVPPFGAMKRRLTPSKPETSSRPHSPNHHALGSVVGVLKKR